MAISRFNTPIQNTLEQYVPLPFQEMAQAAQSIQQRGDLAEQQQAQVELGLASMEALTPGYQKFRDNYVKDYKAKASELLDKYGSNTSDPEFIRNIKRLNLQFSSDPRLQIVKQGNEQYKQNQQLSANMKAQGKLFIAPNQTGLDANGNLTSNLGQVEGVNTLEDWSKSGQIAHSSMVDDGRGNKSNAPNLNNWKKAITSDVDGQRKLIQAYISQGYTPEQATQAVKTEIQGLVNQYGVRSDKSFEWERLQMAKQDRADRIAASKKTNPTEPESPLLRPRITFNGNKSISIPVGDNSRVLSSYTSSRDVASPAGSVTLSGAYKVSKDGKTNSLSRGNFNINNASSTKDLTVYVDSNGKIFNPTAEEKGALNIKDNTYTLNGKTTKLRPVAAREYVDESGNRYYKPLTKQESLKSGFSLKDNIDYKPAFNVPEGGKKIQINHEELANIKALAQQDPNIRKDYNNVIKLVNKRNSGSNLTNEELSEIRNFTSLVSDYNTMIMDENEIKPMFKLKTEQSRIAKDANYREDPIYKQSSLNSNIEDE